jgi:capsular exopolysaccharide synthesis family protein
MYKYQDSLNAIDRREVDITKVFKIIFLYRWLIINTILIMLILAYAFLYTQPSIYKAYSIIKVKDDREFSRKNIMLKPSALLPVDIKKDITLLKTFYMNEQALSLNRVNWGVQYYTFQKGKMSEIFTQIAIEINSLDIKDKGIIGKRLIISPTKDGYIIDFKHSFVAKIKNYISGKPLRKIEKEHSFKYNEIVKTKYFKFRVKKLSNFKNPIEVVFNGESRNIYENIIKNNLQVEQLEADVPIIEISYKDNSQQRAIFYINSLTDSFIAESVKNKSEQSNKILEFINQELDKMKGRLNRSEKSLEEYQVLNNATKPSIQASTFIKKLSEIEIKLSENELKYRLAQNLMKFIHGGHSLDAMAPALMELDEKPTLKLIEILQNSQLKRDALLSEFTIKHPKVIAQQKKIDSSRAKIIKNIENLQKHISQKNINLQKLKTSYESKIKSLPTKERKLVNIQRDYAVSSKMYNFLLEKQAENEIVKVATLSDYKIIDKAYSPKKPISPNLKMTLVASILLGLILGVIIAFIRNAFDNKIRYREDIESRTQLPIYGTLPISENRSLELIDKKKNTHLSESYRALRSRLQFILRKNSEGCKTILVTSTVFGEGKDITTANLSTIFQIANYKTVVIDFDMKKPTLDRFFSVNNVTVGLSNYLKGQIGLYDITYPTIYKNLKLIPVGKRPSNPSELILSKYMPQLMEELKKDYDYIIINTTPFGVMTDTKHLMSYSDINLILLMENYSKKTYISNLNRIIIDDEIENIGVVYIQNYKNYKEELLPIS